MGTLSGDLSIILDQQEVEKVQRKATKLISDLQDRTYVRSTFTKIPQATWGHDNDLPTSAP